MSISGGREQMPMNEFVLPEGKTLEIINSAQLELIKMMGNSESAMDWITANVGRFREIVNDPSRKLIERLANEETHDEAIQEIRDTLYH